MHQTKALRSFAFCAAVVIPSAIAGTWIRPASAYTPTDGANAPVGEAGGLKPGRVTWAHDKNAANWDGSTGQWWEDRWNPQATIDAMVAASLRAVSGAADEPSAWKALFKDFNRARARKAVGYAKGEKIVIKVNQNNTRSIESSPHINTSPQLVLALVSSLVRKARVPEESITVSDPSRYMTDNVFNAVRSHFPRVILEDHYGENGRQAATFKTGAIPFSKPGAGQKDLALSFVNADYVINMPILKGHTAQGVTLSAKNFFGCTAIDPDYKKNAGMHGGFSQKTEKPGYLTFVDFMGHKDLGGKTLLWVMDALYGSPSVGGRPAKWPAAPFADDWPSSIFMSQDGVALDSVAIDFFLASFPTAPDLDFCDYYLHEAAMAGKPPSGFVYDPEQDGSPLESLGVHEHWNDAEQKQYSRNLGTGKGIELHRVEAPRARRGAVPRKKN
jgi:hypothetical protein